MTQHARRIPRLTAVHWLLLLAVGLALFLPGFFTIPPFDRDESRYAQASHQMLETGDFVDIRFQDEARHKKPVGIYWLQTASVSLLTGGETHGPIWMYRIPSLLGALAAVLLTAWAGLRLFGPTVGFAAGIALASTVILGVEARMAKTDAVLLATIVAAQGALLRVYLDRLKPLSPSFGIVLLFWLALGAGILVKGPIILMVSGFTLLALWAMDREIGWAARLRPNWGVPVMLALVLPWGIAIWVATDGAFFSYAIGHEFLGKAHGVQENHWGPPGYYLATFWLTFWPWSLLAVLALPWAWKRRHMPAVRFCAAWILPTWAAFELAPTKLPHYTVTVFPAIACLAAAATLERFEGAARRGLGHWPVAGLFLLVTLAFAGAAVWAPLDMGAGLLPAAIAGAVVILATGVAVTVLEWRRSADRLLGVTAAGAFAALGIVHGVALPGITPMWISPRVAEAVAEHRPCDNSILAAAGYTEPSMVFLVGTKTILGGPEQVAKHLASDPACALGLLAEGHDELAFLAMMAAEKLSVASAAEISGFNYSRGKPVTLRLYRAEAQGEAPVIEGGAPDQADEARDVPAATTPDSPALTEPPSQ